MDEKPKSEAELTNDLANFSGLVNTKINLKTLFDSIAEGVVVVNRKGGIVLVNRRFVDMSEYNEMEILGKSLSKLINKDIFEKHTKHISDFFNQPKARAMGSGLEISLKRKNGTSLPVEISLSYLNTEVGPIGIAFITDMSKQKQAIDDLNKRNIELDAYAHTVAHDLNSSLSGIIGYSRLLLDNSEDIDKNRQQEFIKTIAANAKKMNTIIKELLLFASMEKADVELKLINMKQLVESVCQRLKYQIDNSHSKIIFDTPILNALSYAGWIEEVWYNYISNAIKYGGDIPEIRISSCKLDNNYIKYTVKDSGGGIPEDMLDVLFDGNSAKIGNRKDGHCLGLTIVKSIIEKLGGYVSVESELGKGSEFSFHLKA
jgi:PAS domain S-box-containing protein